MSSTPVTVAQRARSGELSSLERAILETVAYSDVFDYPLTAAEIRRNLAVAASEEDVTCCLAESPALSRLLETSRGYVMFAGRSALAARRDDRRASSDHLWRQARGYGGWIGRLPFVRMVAVTGALALHNSERRDDIDYLIVTAPARVWLVRALTMAIVRLAGLRGATLCPNYLLDETALELADRSAYAARELVQMVPLSGAYAYKRMLGANTWWRDHVPNGGSQPSVAAEACPLLKRALERLLGGRLGDRFERWVFDRKGAELRHQAGANNEASFSATVCKGHFDRHGERTRTAIAERLARLEAGTR